MTETQTNTEIEHASILLSVKRSTPPVSISSPVPVPVPVSEEELPSSLDATNENRLVNGTKYGRASSQMVRSVSCPSPSSSSFTSTTSPSLSSSSHSLSQPRQPDIQHQGENVNAVVEKAKRAATFLWALLHAQICPSNVDNCPHKCCKNAKEILLHIKTCSSSTSAEIACPTNHPGCQQARKLLSHYRKCKEMRTRQRRQARPRHHAAQQAQSSNFCLICTLLARHDKEVSAEQKTKSKLCRPCPSSSSSSSSSSLLIASPLPITPQKTNRDRRRLKPRSKSVQFDLTSGGTKESRSLSFSSANSRDSKSFNTVTTTSSTTTTSNGKSGSAMPPPPPRSSITVTSRGTVFPLISNSSYPFKLKDGNRPRGGSLDERNMISMHTNHRHHSSSSMNDPTIELELRRDHHHHHHHHQNHRSDASEVSKSSVQRQLPFRKRSVSCSLPALPHREKVSGCETIMEE